MGIEDLNEVLELRPDDHWFWSCLATPNGVSEKSCRTGRDYTCLVVTIVSETKVRNIDISTV